MDITIVTTANTDEEALELLKMMGMPFAEAKAKEAPKQAPKETTRETPQEVTAS